MGKAREREKEEREGEKWEKKNRSGRSRRGREKRWERDVLVIVDIIFTLTKFTQRKDIMETLKTRVIITDTNCNISWYFKLALWGSSECYRFLLMLLLRSRFCIHLMNLWLSAMLPLCCLHFPYLMLFAWWLLLQRSGMGFVATALAA